MYTFKKDTVISCIMSLRKTVLAMGIAVVFVIFVAYGLYAVYEPPKRYYEQSKCWEEFDCDKEIRECYEKQRKAVNGSEEPVKEPVPMRGYDECSKDVYGTEEYINCMEGRDDCEDEYRKSTQRYRHARNSFYALFIIALIAIIVGLFLNHLESISSGFFGGGILVLIWSLIYTAEYWLQWNKYVKLTALGIILVILVYFGYKKVEKRMSVSRAKKK
ncbi:hypothetical protein ACFL3V_06285 [Nanoarchaeota archaeon]